MTDKLEQEALKSVFKIRSGMDCPELLQMKECIQIADPDVFKPVIEQSDDFWLTIETLITFITDRLLVCSLKQPYQMFKKTTKDIERGINQLRNVLKKKYPERVSMLRTSKYENYPIDYCIAPDQLDAEFKNWYMQMADTLKKIKTACDLQKEQEIYDLSCDLVILEINMLFLQIARQDAK